MTQKRLLVTASLLGFICVALGAFGAHALKDALMAHGKTDTFELAVRYQFYHALVLLILGLHNAQLHRTASVFFLTGIILFSGSLYFLALANSTALVLVTPIGGIFLLAGWGKMIWTFSKMQFHGSK